jgi:hypothetical protein
MGTVLITVSKRSKRSMAKLARPLFWYDFDQKKMLTFQGGDLKFEYDGLKLKVSSQNVEYVSYAPTGNDNTIQKWITDNADDFGLDLVSADDKLCAVTFDDDSQSDIETALEDLDWEYEIL